MAGEQLSSQQIAFLDRFILIGWFIGSQDQKTTEAYERYLEIEQAFKDAMFALPGKDPRVKELGGQAAGPMTTKNSGHFDDAGRDLALLIPLAKALGRTIASEHAAAVDQFNTIMSGLPDEDPRVQSIASRASGPARTTIVEEMPTAMETLEALSEEATQLGPILVTEHADAVREFQDAIKVLPADDARVKAILDEATAPISKNTAKDSIVDIKTLNDLKSEIEQAKQAIAGDKTKMLDALALLTNSRGATQAERDRVTTAMAGDWPAPDDFAKAQRACDALTKLISAARQLAALAIEKPASAQKMRDLFADWDVIIGDTEVAGATIEQSKVDLAEQKKEFGDAGIVYNNALDMPEDDEEKIRLKEEAVQLATDEYFDKMIDFLSAQGKSRALIGMKLMSEAVIFGPLAPDAGRPFEDAVGEKLIAAFERDPEVANSTIQIARRSVDPAKIAGVVDGLCT